MILSLATFLATGSEQTYLRHLHATMSLHRWSSADLPRPPVQKKKEKKRKTRNRWFDDATAIACAATPG
jgi:hypothetical protein